MYAHTHPVVFPAPAVVDTSTPPRPLPMVLGGAPLVVATFKPTPAVVVPRALRVESVVEAVVPERVLSLGRPPVDLKFKDKPPPELQN